MKSIIVTTAAACALATTAGLASYAGAQVPGEVRRANVGASGVESEDGAGQAAVSADGRFVAFASDAADLVPGDTNGDSDVFVRDRTTDVLQRVSVTSSGAEIRGDSMCPSLSADGRYVAFLSKGTNLLPNGNLPRPAVYVHDRQTRTTTLVSVALDGRLPDRASECPSISADGQRVAFASYATDLVAGDDNRVRDVFVRDLARGVTLLASVAADGGFPEADSMTPSLSADGRYVAFGSDAPDLLADVALPRSRRAFEVTRPHVYVRDLEAERTELVDVAHAHPLDAPDGYGTTPSISGDGRYVAFYSRAKNLAVGVDGEFDKIYVRDRVGGTTWIASVVDPTETDCGREGVDVQCKSGAKGRPAISADGRFVAFSSRTLFHLPANRWSGDQIYVFDNFGWRLRRLSVDPSGSPGEACSWDPAISGDGRVVAYASKSTVIVPDDEGVDVDVFVHERACDADGTCRPLAACPARPLTGCVAADGSLLRLGKQAPGRAGTDELYWRWTGPAGDKGFPDPAQGSYQLCVYGRSLALDVATAAAPACDGGGRPCWLKLGSGYKLLDPKGGLRSVTLSRKENGARIYVRGSGPLLDAPYLPVAASRGLVVQLQHAGSDRCWSADFPATAISRNVAGDAGGRRDGALVAMIP